MAKDLRRIPFKEFSCNVEGVFARVIGNNETVLVEGSDGKLALIKPVSEAKSRSRRKTEADYKAFLSAAGSWGDFDVDAFLKDIYESRKSSRPPVDL